MVFGSLRAHCVCGSKRLRRSARRNLRENLLSFLVLPWRCEDCDRRSHKAIWLRFGKPPNEPRRSGLIDHAVDWGARAFDRGTSDLD
ncbi:MAG TPA: hypothetical protein VEF06_02795 [Bryobacteraceae bacterium]|nr:hypothetical protein [Bryobacteraceae bacterium]